MDKFLGKYYLPKLNEEEADSLNTSITADEIGAGIKKLLTHKSQEKTVSQENFTKHLRKS